MDELERLLEEQAGLLEAQGGVLRFFVERDRTVMGTIAQLTDSLNNYQAAVGKKLAEDQQIIAADNQQIIDLQQHEVPDDLIQKLNDAAASLNAAPDAGGQGAPGGGQSAAA